jgi:hypothetical protein
MCSDELKTSAIAKGTSPALFLDSLRKIIVERMPLQPDTASGIVKIQVLTGLDLTSVRILLKKERHILLVNDRRRLREENLNS